MLLLLCNFFKKGIVNCPARHTYRTCNDLNVFFFCIYISLFVGRSSITFFCCDKRSSHLNTFSTKRKSMLYLSGIHDASGGDNRDMDTIFLTILMDAGDDPADLIIIVSLVIWFVQMIQLFSGKSQMSACVSSFNDYKVCSALISTIPHFQDDTCCFFRRDDRCDLGVSTCHIFRQIYRQTGTGDDHIGTGVGSRFYVIRIVLRGNHDIISDKSLAFAVCICSNVAGFF